MKTVAIIGMGTMGSAIAQTLHGKYDVIGLDQGDELARASMADVVIIAVKPQSFPELGRDLKQYIDGQTVLSIMAGVSCRQISETLGTNRVVRTMPNLGLAKAKSLTGAYAFDQIRGLEELLKLWGQVIWLEKESDFDAFTALAGSGPAYFFELVSQLQLSAEKLGFDKKLAQQIANGVLESANAMLSDESAADKVSQVASKGGTTEAALSVLAKRDFGTVIFEAVQAATKRSKELSK